MTRRTLKANRKLKRVDGDLQLAPMKVDQLRPPTAGVHLKRCHNNIRLGFGHHYRSNALHNDHSNYHSYHHRDRRQKSNEMVVVEKRRESLLLSPSSSPSSSHEYDEQLSQETIGNNLQVPNNSARTGTPVSWVGNGVSVNYLDEVNLVNQNEEIQPQREQQSFHRAYSDRKYSFRIRQTPQSIQQQPQQQVSTFYSATTTYTETRGIGSPNYGVRVTEQRQISNSFEVTKNEDTNVCTSAAAAVAVITTAVSLGLPQSVREYTADTPSPIWSKQNQVGTATPEEGNRFEQVKTVSPSPPTSSIPLRSFSAAEPSAPSSSAENEQDQKKEEAFSRSELGDGDTIISSSAGGGGGEGRQAPPTSTAASGSDRPPFMFTFRRPKPLPRSRITNTAGSTRYSLPVTATASTPNSSTKQQQQHEQEDADENNNNLETPVDSIDLNNNVLEDEEDVNNNPRAKSTRHPPKSSGERSLLSLLKEPVTPPQLETEQIAYGFFSKFGKTAAPKKSAAEESKRKSHAAETGATADASTGGKHVTIDNQTGRKSNAEKAAAAATAAEPEIEWNSQDSSEDEEKEKSRLLASFDSSGNPKSGSEEITSTESGTGTASATSEPPPKGGGICCKTEKGQICFRLPGRIQHKTTIKVAHFPTDDKKVILNVQPDADEEDDEGLTLPIQTGGCSDYNNNFFCPPPQMQMPYPDPAAYYGYSPYGYPPAPYGYPPYYYGYPPYY